MTEQGDKHQSNETTTEKTENKPKRKKTLFRRLLCLISAVVFLPVFLLIAALATESGTGLLVRLTDKLSDALSIESVSGSLQRGLVLNNLRFQTAGVDTQVAQTRLQLDFACLWQRKICVQDVSIKQPTINIDTALLPPSQRSRENNDSTPLHRIDLPLSMAIEKVQVENFALTINRHQMNLAHFHTAASLDNDNGLILSPTQIDGFSFMMQSSADEQQASPKEADNRPIDWAQIEQTLTPPLLANLQQIQLPFDIHVQSIEGKNWQYQQVQDNRVQQDIRVETFRLQADVTDYLLRLQKLDIESSLGKVQAQGQMQLNNDFPLDFKVQTESYQLKATERLVIPPSRAQLQLSGTLKNQTALSVQTQGAVNAELTAQVELNRAKTPFSLHLYSPSVDYPFVTEKADSAPLKVRDIDLQLNGNLLDYQLKLSGQASGMQIPSSQLDLAAKGSLSYADIENLQLNALDGNLHLHGKLDWRNGFQWQSTADLNKINLGAYLKNWPAVLSGKLASTGQVDAQNWQVDLSELDIQGNLAKRALTLKGQLSASKQTLLDIAQLQLNYGDNHITAQGKISRQSDFNLTINAPDLRGLLPDLSASLTGKVNLAGDIDKPDVNLELHGNKIQFQDLRLNKLFAKGKVNVAEQIQGRVDLELTEFNYGDIHLSRADLWLTGREENHQLHLRAKGEPVAAVFNLYGNFDRTSQTWQGILNQIDIKSPIGNLTNDKNIQVNYDNKQLLATVSAHCWHNPDVDLCFPQTFRVGRTGEIPFEIKGLQLDLVNKLTERKELLKGSLNAKGNAAWFTDKAPQVSLQAEGKEIGLAHKIDYRTFKLTIPQLTLNGQLENNNLSLKSDIRLERQGHISTDLKLSDIAKGRKLGGSLVISQLNLNLVNQLLSGGESVSGEVTANLNVGGDLNSPLLNGSFTVDQIKAKMKSLPFELSDGEVNLSFHGKRSTLLGYVQTPDSRLDLNGDANWQDLNRWDSRVQVKTERFSVDIPSMAKLKINADVSAQATPELLRLSGEVAVPWARIAVESLPESAVSVSSDEVILDGKTDKNLTALPTKMAAKTKSGMAIESDLKIRIGEDVNFNAYGLNSNLQGLLAVKQEKGNLGLYGQIALKNGRYASFGQDLLIRKGEIAFSGLPSQPMLNIEAIRNPEAMENNNVVAGIKVIGLADSPNVEVFSEPSMPQDQALSYILTGRSLENSGETGSSGSVGAALLGLGLGKSGKLVGGIGETFGIQDLNLGTAGVGESSKVVVSGNITPRLPVKYGVGLFDGLAEVTLRYKLIPQLYLQSVSGVNQAFDLLYQFDF